MDYSATYQGNDIICLYCCKSRIRSQTEAFTEKNVHIAVPSHLTLKKMGGGTLLTLDVNLAKDLGAAGHSPD